MKVIAALRCLTLCNTVAHWAPLSMIAALRCLTLCNTVAHWAPLSMGFLRQESWSGFPSTSPGDLPGIWSRDLTQVSCIAGGFFTVWATRETQRSRNPWIIAEFGVFGTQSCSVESILTPSWQKESSSDLSLCDRFVLCHLSEALLHTF